MQLKYFQLKYVMDNHISFCLRKKKMKWLLQKLPTQE